MWQPGALAIRLSIYFSAKCSWTQTLQWRHNERDGISHHQPHGCLLNRLFRYRSKKSSKLRVTGLCAENSPVTGESPHKGSVTRKMVPFDYVIMITIYWAFRDICLKLFVGRNSPILSSSQDQESTHQGTSYNYNSDCGILENLKKMHIVYCCYLEWMNTNMP